MQILPKFLFAVLQTRSTSGVLIVALIKSECRKKHYLQIDIAADQTKVPGRNSMPSFLSKYLIADVRLDSADVRTLHSRSALQIFHELHL